MAEIELGSVLKLILVTAVAFWAYRLSETHENALEKEFEAMEFCGQKYFRLDWEEKPFCTRILALLKHVKQKRFGVICEEKEPSIVLLPIEEFLRLKAIEEHLEDGEIARIIEERLANRKQGDPHPMMDFEHFREGVYKEAKGDAITYSKAPLTSDVRCNQKGENNAD